MSLNASEKKTYFFYLLGLFLVATTFLSWVLLKDSFKFNIAETKLKYAKLCAEEAEFDRRQTALLPLIDSLKKNITLYEPTAAIYLSREIEKQLEDLKTEGLQKNHIRFNSFTRAYEIYDEFYRTNKELRGLTPPVNQ